MSHATTIPIALLGIEPNLLMYQKVTVGSVTVGTVIKSHLSRVQFQNLGPSQGYRGDSSTVTQRSQSGHNEGSKKSPRSARCSLSVRSGSHAGIKRSRLHAHQSRSYYSPTRADEEGRRCVSDDSDHLRVYLQRSVHDCLGKRPARSSPDVRVHDQNPKRPRHHLAVSYLSV